MKTFWKWFLRRNQAASEQLERSTAAVEESWRQESFSSELPEGSKTKKSSFDSGVCSICFFLLFEMGNLSIDQRCGAN